MIIQRHNDYRCLQINESNTIIVNKEEDKKPLVSHSITCPGLLTHTHKYTDTYKRKIN